MTPKLLHKKTVSVLLTTFNGEKYILEAINSIINQTFYNFQFIIVNDGSTDFTEQIISSINDPRIEYYKIDRCGHVNALNFGLTKCKTKLTTIIDHDDIASFNKLERQIKLFNSDAALGVLGTSYYRINSGGTIINKIILPSLSEKITKTLNYRDVICHSGVMYRTELIKSTGGYNPKYKTAADYALWLSLINKTKFMNIQEPLMRIRKHELSQTSKLESYSTNNENTLLALHDLLQIESTEEKYITYIWDILYGEFTKGRIDLMKDMLVNYNIDFGTKVKYLLLSLFNRRLINYYFYINPLRKIACTFSK